MSLTLTYVSAINELELKLQTASLVQLEERINM